MEERNLIERICQANSLLNARSSRQYIPAISSALPRRRSIPAHRQIPQSAYRRELVGVGDRKIDLRRHLGLDMNDQIQKIERVQQTGSQQLGIRRNLQVC